MMVTKKHLLMTKFTVHPDQPQLVMLKVKDLLNQGVLVAQMMMPHIQEMMEKLGCLPTINLWKPIHLVTVFEGMMSLAELPVTSRTMLVEVDAYL